MLLYHPQLPCQPHIGLGQVRHKRMLPRQYSFIYPSLFLLLPMHQGWDSALLARNSRAPISFYDRDHGNGDERPLEWLQNLLRQVNIADANGPIWLQTYPRMWGYAFKPVSFWYCYRNNDSLAAIVVEVNNTFGQKHVYVLSASAWGEAGRVEKSFHVSPFCQVSGNYDFYFALAKQGEQIRAVARIHYDDSRNPTAPSMIETSIHGQLHKANAVTLRRALCAHPLHSFAVIVHIHFQAFRLLLKRVPFFGKQGNIL